MTGHFLYKSMTYLERITYLIGNNDALVSYCVSHAIHFKISFKTVFEADPVTRGAEKEAADAALAEEELKRFASLSLNDKISYFEDAGLSKKAFDRLKEGLVFNETLRTTYFKENGPLFEREDPKIYEDKVRELEERNEVLNQLNVYLVKETEKLLRKYYG